MSADRLFQIVYLLLEQERMTADALAEALGVSVRTVYRDVEALSTAGVPVCTTQGKGGGVALMEGYVLDQSAFSREEQRLLLGALREFPQQSEEQILNKLAVLFRRREEDWIHADLSRWGSSGQENEVFQLLRRAIWSRHAVRSYTATPMRPLTPGRCCRRGWSFWTGRGTYRAMTQTKRITAFSACPVSSPCPSRRMCSAGSCPPRTLTPPAIFRPCSGWRPY